MKKVIFMLSLVVAFVGCSVPASVDIKPKVFKSVFDISVQNDDSFEWKDVVVAINSDYEYKVTKRATGCLHNHEQAETRKRVDPDSSIF